MIGDKRPPSRLGEIQPDHWLPEYTTELLDVLNVLGLLIDLEVEQAPLLDAICVGPTISLADLSEAGALKVPDGYPIKPFRADQVPPGDAQLRFE